MAVPRNAPNLAAAMVLANELASPAQVYARAKPGGWGSLPATSYATLPLGWQDLINDLATVTSPLTPSLAGLKAAAMTELPVNVQARLESDWTTSVGHSSVRWVGA